MTIDEFLKEQANTTVEGSPAILLTLIDKSHWDDGPWQTDGDVKVWMDLASGYACVLLRSPLQGNLNGYINIPSSLEWKKAQCSAAITYVDDALPEYFHYPQINTVAFPHDKWIGFDTLGGRFRLPVINELPEWPEANEQLKKIVQTLNDIGSPKEEPTLELVQRSCSQMAQNLSHIGTVE